MFCFIDRSSVYKIHKQPRGICLSTEFNKPFPQVSSHVTAASLAAKKSASDLLRAVLFTAEPTDPGDVKVLVPRYKQEVLSVL